MFLETKDGVAILGYSGLGETALGTEPADWMSAVLRGRPLSLEHSLGALADAIKKQIPPHLVGLPKRAPLAHSVIAPGICGWRGEALHDRPHNFPRSQELSLSLHASRHWTLFASQAQDT